jgi:plastocyanin
MFSSIRNICATACLAAFAATAFAGGSIKVTATYEGQVPNFKPIDMGQDKVCVEHYKDGTPPVNEALVLGEGQKMANVLVEVISGLPAEATYPAPTEPAVLLQEGCRYSPRLFVVRAGQPLKIRNPDGTLHNVNAQPKVNAPFNRGMPANVQEIEVVFDKPEPLFPITCNVHPWMRSNCAVLSHPFFAVTDTTGTGTVADLPPGEYEIRATHEVLGEKTAKLTVQEGQTAEIAFTFTRPTKK